MLYSEHALQMVYEKMGLVLRSRKIEIRVCVLQLSKADVWCGGESKIVEGQIWINIPS